MKTRIFIITMILIDAILISSCKILRIVNESKNTIISFEEKACKFEFVDNQILLRTIFPDSIPKNYMLDLGSPISVVFANNSQIPDLTNKSESNYIGRTTSADGKPMKREYKHYGTIITNLFKIENSYISTLHRPDPFICNKLSGMWGSDLFCPDIKSKRNKILLIQMQDSTMAILDSLPKLDNWVNLNAQFTVLSHIKIKIIIVKKELEFIFDTGFAGCILMNRETFLTAQKELNLLQDQNQIYGYITNTLSGTQLDTAYRARFKMDLGNGIIMDSATVISTEAVTVNAIGMEFIKKFNILVDYQENELYLQPNPNYLPPKETFFISKGFKAKNMNENHILVINMELNGPAEKAGLKVGDQILSINNIEADKGDNCEAVRLFGEIDGKSNENTVKIKRDNEILKLKL